MFCRSIGVTRRQRDETGEDPEEWDALYDVGRDLVAWDARRSHIRRTDCNLGWSIDEQPDEVQCAAEAYECREAHQDVDELLDL